MNGELLKSIDCYITLRGIHSLNKGGNKVMVGEFNELGRNFTNSLSEDDKVTFQKYTSTLSQFDKHGFKFDAYSSFEVDTGGGCKKTGFLQQTKTRVVNVGDYILAIDGEYICRFNNLSDMFEGGNGKCVEIGLMDKFQHVENAI